MNGICFISSISITTLFSHPIHVIIQPSLFAMLFVLRWTSLFLSFACVMFVINSTEYLDNMRKEEANSNVWTIDSLHWRPSRMSYPWGNSVFLWGRSLVSWLELPFFGWNLIFQLKPRFSHIFVWNLLFEGNFIFSDEVSSLLSGFSMFSLFSLLTHTQNYSKKRICQL